MKQTNSRLYHRLHQWVEQRWWQNTPPCFPIRSLGFVYHHLNQYNLKRRMQRQVVPPIPVISVGNITVGGSGKTPFVLWLSQQLIQLGYKPVVVCRGDGGKSQALRRIQVEDSALDMGDEAKLLAQQCQCPVIRGQDRVQAAQIAAQLGDVMILDDGFQYRQLQCYLDIVLVPHIGVGNACVLPAGPMREPVTALQRADMIVRTGGQNAVKLSNQVEWWWSCQAGSLKDMQTFQTKKPQQTIALSSIARPQRFVASLEEAGIQVVQQCFFPDHHVFSVQDIEGVLASNIAVVVTAKDAVKLLHIWPKNKALWVLGQEVHCEQGLMEKIHGHMLRAEMENHHVG